MTSDSMLNLASFYWKQAITSTDPVALGYYFDKYEWAMGIYYRLMGVDL
jgi:hypothetical protein